MTAVQSVVVHECSAPTVVPIRAVPSNGIISGVNIYSAESMQSNIVYEILARHEDNGMYIPDKLGEGRFAKVYKCWQRSDGQNLRLVAIKILHNTARYSDQELFIQEIDRLRELSVNTKSKAVKILDVVQLEPMIMCGCGRVYNPRCPNCGRHQLKRQDHPNAEYPSLACPDKECNYTVSAMNIEMQYKRLTSPPAKSCCTEGLRAHEGTIINFVDRPAVVLELEECTLAQSGQQRKKYFQEHVQQSLEAKDQVIRPLTGKRRLAQEQLRLERAIALDKLMHMVQVAESVAWLHTEMKIIHKDLTPDNIMVNYGHAYATSVPGKNRTLRDAQEVISDMVSHPDFLIKVIDFGLAGRESVTRKWYEEKDINISGMEKQPYFSPEAGQRFQRVSVQLSVDQMRFLVPQEILKSPLGLHESDILSFQWDLNHEHDLTITRLEQGPEPNTCYAYFDGKPPPLQQHREIQLILPLGEAHDIYSVGALFYFILTEQHRKVQSLASFVAVLQDRPCELTAYRLKRRHGETYLGLRDYLLIPDPHWRDRVMELILRAMVRGRTHSFNKSRVERGPESALDLLRETRRIYRGVQEELISEQRVRRRSLWVGIPLCVTLAFLAMVGANKLRSNPAHFILLPSSSADDKTPRISTPPSHQPQVLDHQPPSPPLGESVTSTQKSDPPSVEHPLHPAIRTRRVNR